MKDYEVKVSLRDDLTEEEKAFVMSKIDEYMKLYDMYLHEDGVTYSMRKPHKKYADIPSGVKFYFRLKKIENFLSRLEYYNYAEGDLNGRINRCCH